MILTEPKSQEEILKMLEGYKKIFLVGCGECATTCKTGGKDQLLQMQQHLELHGKTVVASCIPESPCVAAQMKTEIAKNIPALKQAQAVLVLACGLGVQSFKDNNRLETPVFPACNTVSAALLDGQGNLMEKCSLCGDCVLADTGGICPVTLCSKGIMNGPCGGMDKGKCEVDREKDCAWVLIFKEAEKHNRTKELRKISSPKNFKKNLKPHKVILSG